MTCAAPILLSFADEIALKAWQFRERNGPSDKPHDLLELFDGWGDDARRRLEERMPEVPNPVAALPPVYPGIRNGLRQNRNLFVKWRYAHEHDSLWTETGILKKAPWAIVETYYEVPPQASSIP